MELSVMHTTENGARNYIVSQYGQVAEYTGAENNGIGAGQTVFMSALSKEEARHKAIDTFRKIPLKEYLVFGDGSVYDVFGCADTLFGEWKRASLNGVFMTAVFAKNEEEAKGCLS